MYEFSGGKRITRGKLPPGRAGTVRTLQIMRQLARSGASNMTVRETAHEIIRNAGVRGHDFVGEMRALFHWVTNHVRYVKDPLGVETLQAPHITIQKRMGDCDDKSILLSSLLLSIGHPARVMFRAIGATRRGFSHVYVVATVDGKAYPLDPTKAGTRFGWEFPRPAMQGDFAL